MTAKAEGCVVCGASDQRMLTTMELSGGAGVTLCGSHALLYRRAGACASTIAELRDSLSERREVSRRQPAGDELGERLIAAFSRDRRGAERRA